MAASDEEALSPKKNRLKFLCSYGGKILPRPSDGQLKYVGGETRAVTVPRSITFSELKEKIDGMFRADLVIKYQMLPEDLDALVSVRSDEDLQYMLDEYDRHERLPRSPTAAAAPCFRLFLFSTSTPSASATATPRSPLPNPDGYVDSANGNNHRPIFTLSASTSPTNTIDAASPNHAALLLSARTRAVGGSGGMHRVRSTPNLSGSQLASNGAIGGGSPRLVSRHLQPKHSMGYGGGGAQWRGPGGGGPYLCGCGCGCPVTGQQMMMRRYYYPPAACGPSGSGGCVCWGDDAQRNGGGQGFHSSGAPPPPPRRPTFE